jgi:hypothetical protein
VTGCEGGALPVQLGSGRRLQSAGKGRGGRMWGMVPQPPQPRGEQEGEVLESMPKLCMAG